MKNIFGPSKPELSIVVIAYNNELYIEEALESVAAQTFKNFECIVVNDCSTDRTSELIDAFVAKDERFKAIHLTENSGGCSVPRNTGLAASTSDYLMFLDGDDWYTHDACEKMLAASYRTNSDIVSGQVVRTNNYHIWYKNLVFKQDLQNISVKEMPAILFDSLSVNKIYKRSFLDRHQLRFPEGIHYEDVLFTGKAYFLADSISIITQNIYYWRVVTDTDPTALSITNRRHEIANLKNRLKAHSMWDEFIYENNLQLYKGHKNNKFLRHDMKLYLNDYKDQTDKYRVEFHEIAHEYFKNTFDPYEFLRLPTDERILYFLIYKNDVDGFNDYIKYVNNEEIPLHRIMIDGANVYFVSEQTNQNEKKFLKLPGLKARTDVKRIELSDDLTLSVELDFSVFGFSDSEVTATIAVKNDAAKYAQQLGLTAGPNRVDFILPNLPFGKYTIELSYKVGNKTGRHVLSNSEVTNFRLQRASNETHQFSIGLYKNNFIELDVIPTNVLKKNVELIKQSYLFGKISHRFDGLLTRKQKTLSIKPYVMFESHMGKQYSDSPKYIYEELLKMDLPVQYIWSFEEGKHVTVPGNPMYVTRGTEEYKRLLGQSLVIVDNQGVSQFFKKQARQLYVQTWHGTPLKKMGHDKLTGLSTQDVNRLKKQVSAWDVFLSSSPYNTTIFKQAFQLDANILECGSPRNDLLLANKDSLSKQVKASLGIASESRVILFAPTFRDWNQNSVERTSEIVQQLSESLNRKDTLLLRLHYLEATALKDLELPPNVIDVSKYEDIQELYIISDVAVTDYSSVMFDFALTRKPMIFYCPDMQEYWAYRGMYFDLREQSPGPVVMTCNDLIECLKDTGWTNDFQRKYDDFVKEFSTFENGTASREVARLIASHIAK
ncbi:CDP-glycerol glycerophosphotransferase family protein [Exiguobacterium sp. s6]|uniref:bifunctional glycosyltransferase/CDP-glycerol:glycerophosphate glycerophosphotransferase n=1 Tax=Exiguobacterium sp. s6 TaxID=2751236 RepID=UPI001BECF434|nr:CDP-glycerol glycerophosphotransferase family protein [Exiguobacterium sp. s6]